MSDNSLVDFIVREPENYCNFCQGNIFVEFETIWQWRIFCLEVCFGMVTNEPLDSRHVKTGVETDHKLCNTWWCKCV
jgi:galactose-1-phosphate uridylyltransferase